MELKKKTKLVGGIKTHRNGSEKNTPPRLSVVPQVCGYLTENVTHVSEVGHDVTALHTASRFQIPVDSGAAATVV